MLVVMGGGPAEAMTARPAPEILRALDLYDAKRWLAAAELAERLLDGEDVPPHDRRLLAELAGAGYRDAYLKARRGQADPSHLCAGLRVLSAYLAEPQADPTTARLRDELVEIKTRNSVVCHDDGPAETVEVVAAPPVVPAPAVPAVPVVSSARSEEVLAVPLSSRIEPRDLWIAGGVALGLAGALLAGMSYGLGDQRRLRGQMDDIDAAAAGRRLTPEERDDLLALRSWAIRRGHLAVGAGVASAVLTVVGVALLVRGRNASARSRAVTPLLGPTGAGLRLQF